MFFTIKPSDDNTLIAVSFVDGEAMNKVSPNQNNLIALFGEREKFKVVNFEELSEFQYVLAQRLLNIEFHEQRLVTLVTFTGTAIYVHVPLIKPIINSVQEIIQEYVPDASFIDA